MVYYTQLYVYNIKGAALV